MSQPYVPGGTVYWTTYTYDALGRTAQVALPNSSGTTAYAYVGNTVTTTDPAGKWKKFTQNGVGSLTKVTEPNPAGGTWDTDYTYHPGGKLYQVSMLRNGNTQTRTFNYNTSGQLLSSVNPETGTVTYTYNTDSTLATKTDAKNQKVEYVYDAYKRVTEVKRYPVAGGAEDTCQKTKYFYDVNTFDGSFSPNTWGGWWRPSAGHGPRAARRARRVGLATRSGAGG